MGGVDLNRISYYEELLYKKKRHEDVEAVWDARAKEFSDAQNNQVDMIPLEVTKYLVDNNILQEETTILDIGGGSGRYAIPMAKVAQKVTITDISNNMLKYAEENAQKNGVNNIEYVKLDFNTANIEEIGWQGKYDVVFAAMCPAIKSAKDIDKMIAASKGSCCIGQFIERTDNIATGIMRALDISDADDPHNDRAAAYAFFNILWLKGYEPRITYFKEDTIGEYDLEEIKDSYINKYSAIAEEKNKNVEEIISRFAINNKITVSKKKTVALIYWEIQ